MGTETGHGERPTGKLLVYCKGRPVHVEQAADGSYTCACGQNRVGVAVGYGYPWRTPERVIAGFDPDHRAEELERRDRELSVIDFDSPFKDAA